MAAEHVPGHDVDAAYAFLVSDDVGSAFGPQLGRVEAVVVRLPGQPVRRADEPIRLVLKARSVTHGATVERHRFDRPGSPRFGRCALPEIAPVPRRDQLTEPAVAPLARSSHIHEVHFSNDNDLEQTAAALVQRYGVKARQHVVDQILAAIRMSDLGAAKRWDEVGQVVDRNLAA